MEFFRGFPVRVEEITGTVGAAATGSVMTVTDNQLAIDLSLPLDAAPLVKAGMRVAIDEQALGVKATGVVETVAGPPARGVSTGTTSTWVSGSIRHQSGLRESRSGSRSRRVDQRRRHGGSGQCAVACPHGTSRIQVQNQGTLEYVVVKPGLSTHGFVEVAAEDGKLSPGQLVVVGYSNPDTKDQK